MYLLESFAPNRHKNKKSWLPFAGFAYVMLYVLLQRPAATAIQGLAVAEYLSRLFSTCKSKQELKLLAACIMCKFYHSNHFKTCSQTFL